MGEVATGGTGGGVAGWATLLVGQQGWAALLVRLRDVQPKGTAGKYSRKVTVRHTSPTLHRIETLLHTNSRRSA